MVVAACAAVGGCSSEPPPAIEIGTAKGTGQRVTYPTVRDSTGYFHFDRWPPACSLLTEAEIKSVLPQAENVRLEAGDTEIKLIPSGREVTASRAKCTITVELPGIRAGIDISEMNAGIPVGRLPKSELPSTDNGTDIGDGCVAQNVGAEVECAKGLINFQIRTPFSYQQRERSREKKLRYSVGGKVTTFDVESGSPQEKWAFERKHITIPLAKIITAKL